MAAAAAASAPASASAVAASPSKEPKAYIWLAAFDDEDPTAIAWFTDENEAKDYAAKYMARYFLNALRECRATFNVVKKSNDRILKKYYYCIAEEDDDDDEEEGEDDEDDDANEHVWFLKKEVAEFDRRDYEDLFALGYEFWNSVHFSLARAPEDPERLRRQGIDVGEHTSGATCKRSRSAYETDQYIRGSVNKCARLINEAAEKGEDKSSSDEEEDEEEEEEEEEEDEESEDDDD
jgi:hypothetical protein